MLLRLFESGFDRWNDSSDRVRETLTERQASVYLQSVANLHVYQHLKEVPLETKPINLSENYKSNLFSR